jgi:hypothetical protein
MQYFQKFPSILYQMSEAANGVFTRIERTVPNMTVRLKLEIFDDKNTPYNTYRISDTDRPDTIAAQMYGSSRYAWVIMLANDMKDWYDWPLTDREFYNYMNAKYETTAGANDGFEASKSVVYQYRWNTDNQILIVDAETYAELSDSEKEIIYVHGHEQTLNDNRRLIRLPTLDALPSILDQFDAAVAQQ